MARTNAERARAYRENKKRREAEAAALLAQGLQPPPEAADEGAIQVTVNAPSAQQQATTLTLKERLFGGQHKVQVPSPGGGKPATARKKEGAGGGKKLALVSSAMPTILAGVLVANVRDRLPEDYQPCAPTRQEASAMLTPLFEELARYVEVTGRASETVVNLINVLVAMLAYGARSYVTYVEIKHANRKKILVEGSLAAASASAAAPLSAAGRGDEAAAAGASGVDAFWDAAGGTGRDDYGYGTSDPDGSSGGERSDAERVADLFRRDRAGRVGLGLLPQPVQ